MPTRSTGKPPFTIPRSPPLAATPPPPIGCGLCAKSCPYGNINMHELADGSEQAKAPKKAITCDLCADLAEPSCVYACPSL
mgnify:CR=1 FL=1